MEKKYRIFFILVLISFIVLIYLPAAIVDEEHMNSQLGELTLNDKTFSLNEIYYLDGEWKYSNDNFIMSNPKEQTEITMAKLPSKYVVKDDPKTPYKGFGTISLDVLLAEEERGYGLNVEYVGTAYRVYIDGVLYGQIGNPTERIEEAVELYSPLAVYFRASGTTHIDIEFINYKDSFSYLKSVRLGSKESIERYRSLMFSRDLISIILVVFLSIFGMGYYLIRKTSKRALYFALLCFNFGIRGFVINERILHQIVPTLSWGLFMRIGYVPLFFGLYLFVQYLKLSIEGAFPIIFEKGVKGMAITFTFLSFFTTVDIMSIYMLPITLITYVLILLVAFINVIKKYLRHREKLTILISLGTLLLVLIFDIVANFVAVSIPYFNALGLMLFFIFQAGDLGREFGQAFNEAEELGIKNKQLADDLVMLNSSLENLVEQRTTDLIMRTEELEITNKKLRGMNKHLENLSFIDELTKIPNRRMFFSEIDKTYYIAQRENRTMILMLIDIDYFKKYNDLYGHVKGDWCLFNIAQTIEQIASERGYLAARYGGEEFIVAGFDVTREEGIAFGEAIRGAISEMGIVHEGNDASDSITVSIGGVYCELSIEESIMTIVKKADDLLYQAKFAGRNKFLI